MMKTFRVMTFNIRFDKPEEGDRSWDVRKPLVAEAIRQCHPHILGLQEATWRQIRDLKNLLPDYIFCLKGRVWDDTCQYPTLAYRSSDLQCLENGEFWLSTTPSVHRSKDWGSAFPRMLSYATFQFIEDGDGQDREFLVGVTHLDNKSERARLRQANIIVDWFKEQDYPGIVMGDFNEVPDGDVYKALCSSFFVDTWKELGFPEDESAITHHDFRGSPDVGRLDWILVTHHFMVLNGEIVRFNQEGTYPSDHFPYYVDVALKEVDSGT
ncbi:MAG: endonuclease/exonuclease/phosphatase family protein [Deltaproteobacteria bacterium]|nr:endonuclease/exonuclease/phosphatase family protein [Deltaproteobacteria bacterium]MBW2069195.1 endonuclease/exonuclease/phosphatase family protein [Deltaproteobacteria bacterium]